MLVASAEQSDQVKQLFLSTPSFPILLTDTDWQQGIAR